MSKMTVGKITFQRALDSIPHPIERIRLRVLERRLEAAYQELESRVTALERKVKQLQKKMKV